jgi:antitoxin CcdA
MPKRPALSGYQQAPRRAVNLTISEPLLRAAKELEINISAACERGLAEAVRETRAQRWLRENRAAMDSWNEYVEQHGLPLSEFRQF